MLTQPFGSDLEIYVNELFLSSEELAYLDSEIEKANLENTWAGESGNTMDTGTWGGRNLFLPASEKLSQILSRVIGEYVETIKPLSAGEIELAFEKGVGPLNRTMPGQSLPAHDDMGPPELDLPVAHGVVIYINDDYEGGQLYYSKLGLEIKPKRGMLVIHSAAALYEHGVRQVTSGIRYGLTLFVNNPDKMQKS